MLKHLHISDVGPAARMELDFGERLNVITGDNGLGKSFILDIAWWALTRKWPAEINKRLTSGFMAKPQGSAPAEISFTFTAKSKTHAYTSKFDRKLQTWTGRSGRPSNPGLVLYAQVDGSFSLWDPARNYWRTRSNVDVQDRPSAYVFSPRDVWDGLRDEQRGLLCNGLIADWAGWQKEQGRTFQHLKAALASLSATPQEELVPGELTRISLDDPRDIPTLKMPYGQSVPVVFASAGMRRIISLAYLLVWSWEEHQKASALLGENTTQHITFLIDEVEAHLHPEWQRRIIKGLLAVMEALTGQVQVQIITATHSPLVLASIEPLFDADRDCWFDLDFDSSAQPPRVVLEKRPFVLHGDANGWLTSEAFDLKSTGALEVESLKNEAAELLKQPQPAQEAVRSMTTRLQSLLGPTDPYWLRWQAILMKRDLL